MNSIVVPDAAVLWVVEINIPVRRIQLTVSRSGIYATVSRPRP